MESLFYFCVKECEITRHKFSPLYLRIRWRRIIIVNCVVVITREEINPSKLPHTSLTISLDAIAKKDIFT